ncbi:hypothetical protein BJF78_12725 [Pseudonocardia sp. CNS-139]|nr:hypothetical protein BJF78_12725 [Pseudonocardia sp. CNS-139]
MKETADMPVGKIVVVVHDAGRCRTCGRRATGCSCELRLHRRIGLPDPLGPARPAAGASHQRW